MKVGSYGNGTAEDYKNADYFAVGLSLSTWEMARGFGMDFFEVIWYNQP